MEQQKVILLNVYDIHSSNAIFGEIGLGLYHSGIEVTIEGDDSLSHEYSFSKVGVSKTIPRMNIFGPLRVTIPLGRIRGTATNIHRIIAQMAKTTFAPGKYDLINNNCNHFTDAVAFALLETRIPPWINRIAQMGSVFVAPNSSEQVATTSGKSSKSSRTPAVRQVDNINCDQAESAGWLCGITLPFIFDPFASRPEEAEPVDEDFDAR